MLFGWECCAGWYKFAHIIELFIMDAFVDLFITLCIVVNTLFMAMEQDGMDHQMETTLKYGNYVSSAGSDSNCSLERYRELIHQYFSSSIKTNLYSRHVQCIIYTAANSLLSLLPCTSKRLRVRGTWRHETRQTVRVHCMHSQTIQFLEYS